MSIFRTEREAFDFVERNAKADPVACAGCTACCRGDQAVVLIAAHGDDPSLYGEENICIENYKGEFEITLKRHRNGDCIFLKDGACSIYDKRPSVCRGFDCRRIVYGTTRIERRESIRSGTFSKEIISAGMERLPTIKLHPLEAKILGTPEYKEFTMTGKRVPK